MATERDEAKWEVRVRGPVSGGSRGRAQRDFIATKRGSREFAGVTIIAVLPWRESERDERAQEQRCVELFLRCAKDMARQDQLPLRR